jgi:preprotein translocase subunit YajC
VGQYGSIILIVVMIIAFYFLIMRPQRKRQQQQQDMMKTLEPGARVVTTTGIYATIIAVGDKQIVLETSPGSQVTMLKQAVGRVVGTEEEDAELSGYRGGGGAPAQPLAATEAEQAPSTEDEPGADVYGRDAEDNSSASGLAGGAPITEYTPGSAPGWTDPEHQTSPWPPAASSEPASSTEDQDTEEKTSEDKNSDR